MVHKIKRVVLAVLAFLAILNRVRRPLVGYQFQNARAINSIGNSLLSVNFVFDDYYRLQSHRESFSCFKMKGIDTKSPALLISENSITTATISEKDAGVDGEMEKGNLPNSNSENKKEEANDKNVNESVTAHTTICHIRRNLLVTLEGADDSRSASQQNIDKRWYAGLTRSGPAFGMSAMLSCFNPKVEDRDFSLIQTAVFNNDPTHPEQTIEAGWQKIGHDHPRLFIFFTRTGYDQQGPGNTAYVKNFDDDDKNPGDFIWLDSVPRPRSQLFYGLPLSHIDGRQEAVSLRWKLQTGISKLKDGWYLALNEQFVGYYPGSLFTKPPPAPTSGPQKGVPWSAFDPTKTLAYQSSGVTVYGEIFDADYNRAKTPPGIPTTTDMGSGKFPSEGFFKSAFIGNIQHKLSSSKDDDTWMDADNSWTVDVWDPKDPNGNPYDLLKYAIQFVPTQGTDFGSYCYIGGPGEPQASGTWSEWDSISPFGLDVPPKIHIVAISRTVFRTDLLALKPDGIIYSCYWSDEDWSGINSVDEWAPLDWGQTSPKFGWGTTIVVVSRAPEIIDVFAQALDGHIWTAWWVDGQNWSGWQNISSTMTFPKDAPIAAVSRSPGQLDVFVNNGGTILGSYWTQDNGWSGGNSDWYSINDGQLELDGSTSILALARSEDQMDMFLTDVDGAIWDASYVTDPAGPEHSWSSFEDIGSTPDDTSTDPPTPTAFAPGTKIAGVNRGSDKINLFAVGPDENLYTTNWTSESGWSSLGDGNSWDNLGSAPANSVFDPTSSDILALVRTGTSNIDIFVTGTEGLIHRTAWDDTQQEWMASSTGNGVGWDEGIGGAIRQNKIFPLGFSFTAVSRLIWGLTVLTVDNNGSIIVTEYQGP